MEPSDLAAGPLPSQMWHRFRELYLCRRPYWMQEIASINVILRDPMVKLILCADLTHTGLHGLHIMFHLYEIPLCISHFRLNAVQLGPAGLNSQHLVEGSEC